MVVEPDGSGAEKTKIRYQPEYVQTPDPIVKVRLSLGKCGEQKPEHIEEKN
jgi:hypothetical protein